MPSYTLDRLNLFAGNDVPSEPGSIAGFVPVSALTEKKPDVIAPSHDGLFTSGTLGRYSTYLRDLEEYQANTVAETAAD